MHINEAAPDDQCNRRIKNTRLACVSLAPLSPATDVIPEGVPALHYRRAAPQLSSSTTAFQLLTSASYTTPHRSKHPLFTMATNAPTLINLPPPPSDPATPSEIPYVLHTYHAYQVLTSPGARPTRPPRLCQSCQRSRSKTDIAATFLTTNNLLMPSGRIASLV